MSAPLPTAHCPLPAGLDAEVREAEPLAPHTTFRIGGPADWWVRPATVEALQEVVAACAGNFTLLGKGSNVLVRDGGIRGVVFNLSRLDHYRREGARLVVGAGLSLGSLLVRMRRQGLGGLEDLVGIPGTVGAAVRMNAGAHDDAMADLVLGARVMDRIGRLRWRSLEELDLCYRGSGLAPDEVVVEVALQVTPCRQQAVERSRRRMAEKRAAQPLDLPNAGSIFKNPPGHAAWQLIREVGLAGRRIGNAEISDAHTNFIVNRGGARSQEVEALIELARSEVFSQTGIELDLEVVILGEEMGQDTN